MKFWIISLLSQQHSFRLLKLQFGNQGCTSVGPVPRKHFIIRGLWPTEVSCTSLFSFFNIKNCDLKYHSSKSLYFFPPNLLICLSQENFIMYILNCQNLQNKTKKKDLKLVIIHKYLHQNCIIQTLSLPYNQLKPQVTLLFLGKCAKS